MLISLLEHFCFVFFLRFTGVDKAGGVCGAQPLSTEKSFGKGVCL